MCADGAGVAPKTASRAAANWKLTLKPKTYFVRWQKQSHPAAQQLG
jgi:hypothetical protein